LTVFVHLIVLEYLVLVLFFIIFLGIVGLTAQEAFDICFEAGKNPKVKMFDLSEYNPKIEEYRTGKLVSFMFYYFAMGLSLRILQNESK
jgi:hypothetical protein